MRIINTTETKFGKPDDQCGLHLWLAGSELKTQQQHFIKPQSSFANGWCIDDNDLYTAGFLHEPWKQRRNYCRKRARGTLTRILPRRGTCLFKHVSRLYTSVSIIINCLLYLKLRFEHLSVVHRVHKTSPFQVFLWLEVMLTGQNFNFSVFSSNEAICFVKVLYLIGHWRRKRTLLKIMVKNQSFRWRYLKFPKQTYLHCTSVINKS